MSCMHRLSLLLYRLRLICQCDLIISHTRQVTAEGLATQRTP